MAFFFRQPTGPWAKKFACHPLPAKTPEDAFSGKIYLPSTALAELSQRMVQYPLMFSVKNPVNGKTTNCGVLEFSAKEGQCNLPAWMMRQLEIQRGTIVEISYTELPPGQFVMFQPMEAEFLSIMNPRVVLEKSLRNYSCLTTDDVISIFYNQKQYDIKVVETKPSPAITIVEVDVQVDFMNPPGMAEPVPASSSSHPDFRPEEMDEEPAVGSAPSFVPFGGVGQKITAPALNIPKNQQQKKQEQSSASPVSAGSPKSGFANSPRLGNSFPTSFTPPKPSTKFVMKDAKPLEVAPNVLYFGYTTIPYNAENATTNVDDPWANLQGGQRIKKAKTPQKK